MDNLLREDGRGCRIGCGVCYRIREIRVIRGQKQTIKNITNKMMTLNDYQQRGVIASEGDNR